MAVAVKLRNATLFKNHQLILSNTNFCLLKNQIYALCGPSGCGNQPCLTKLCFFFHHFFSIWLYLGKSTLCQVIIQELQLNSGVLTLYEGNRSLAIPGKDVGKIKLLSYCFKIPQNVSFGLFNFGIFNQFLLFQN